MSKEGKARGTAGSVWVPSRRNVLRAAVLYVGAIWALAQGIAQLGPSFDAPDWTTRWFVIAAAAIRPCQTAPHQQHRSRA